MAPTLTKIGFCQSVISRSSPILISRSSGPGPVGVAAGAALVDALRQVAHRGDAVGDLLAEQHAAAAGLRALADDDLDRVGPAQVVRVHPVARGQQLVDEHLRVAALLGRHAAVAGRRRGAHLAGAAAERLLGGRRQRAEAHAGDRDRDLQLERLLREARPEHDVRVAALAVALERIARHARAEEQQVVEVRQLAAWRRSRGCRRCPRARRAGSRRSRCGRRGPTRAGPAASRRSSVRPRVVDREVVELPRRAVAPELGRVDVVDPRRARAGRAPARRARRASPSRCSRRRARRPCRARRSAPRRSSRRARRRRRRRRRGSRSAP